MCMYIVLQKHTWVDNCMNEREYYLNTILFSQNKQHKSDTEAWNIIKNYK